MIDATERGAAIISRHAPLPGLRQYPDLLQSKGQTTTGVVDDSEHVASKDTLENLAEYTTASEAGPGGRQAARGAWHEGLP